MNTTKKKRPLIEAEHDVIEISDSEEGEETIAARPAKRAHTAEAAARDPDRSSGGGGAVAEHATRKAPSAQKPARRKRSEVSPHVALFNGRDWRIACGIQHLELRLNYDHSPLCEETPAPGHEVEAPARSSDQLGGGGPGLSAQPAGQQPAAAAR